jgi:hypothetical protein
MLSLKNEFLFESCPAEFGSRIPARHHKLRSYLSLPSLKRVVVDGIESWDYPEESDEEYLSSEVEPTLDRSYLSLSWIVMNKYGALILCSTSLLIADIDAEHLDCQSVKEKLTPWYTRVYKTHSGFRVISTLPVNYYGSYKEITEVLENLGSDPKYVGFFRKQQYGRARLTPKPWRWNGESDCQVCRLVFAFGSRSTLNKEQEDAIRVHDLITGSSSRGEYPLY